MTRVSSLVCPLLVGRDDLLDLADRRLTEAAAGRGQFLLLAGEAGVGKSRFIAALDRKAGALGFFVAEGDLAPQDRIVPGALVQDLVRNMLKVRAFDRLVDSSISLPDALPGMEFQSRRLLVRDLVDRIAESLDTPTLLIIEDLQWADDLSLEIVADLARRIRDRPVLIVGAYRTDELPTGTILREWRARLLTQRIAEEARLAPLTLDQTALMTTLILSTGLPAPREVVAAVHERTDGIPLHIEELLGALTDEARSDGRAIREATVPATIEDAVLARFQGLSAEGRALAQAGAVIGRCFVPEVVAGIMDLPLDALDAPLQELVDQAFLYPFSSKDVGFFDYRHQLLRDVLYRTVPRTTLRRLHARAGEFGAQLEGASEIHASAHFERAGLRDQAYSTALSGAETAVRLSAHREACELFERAIDNMPGNLDPGVQGALFGAYSWEAVAHEQYQKAEAAAWRARQNDLEAGLPVAAARQLAALATIARREARPIETRRKLIDQGLLELAGLAVTPERESVRALLQVQLSEVHFDVLDLAAARRMADLGAETARRSGVTDGAAIAGVQAGMIESPRQLAAEVAVIAEILTGMIDVQLGDIDRGLARIIQTAQDAEAAGISDSVTAYRSAVLTAIRMMRYQVAETALRDGLRIANEIDQSHCRHVMRAAAALVDWTFGRWEAAHMNGEQELAEHGCAHGGIGAEVALGYVAFGYGDFDHARSMLRSARAAGERSGAVALILPALWGLAETEVMADNPVLAFDICTEAFGIASRAGERALFAPFAVTGVRALLAAGRPEEGARWATLVSEYLEPWASVARPAIDHADGLVKFASGATGMAREALDAAITGWGERDRIWESTWARLDLAACLLRSNRYAEAAGQLTMVRETATKLHSEPLLARTDELSNITSRHGSFDEPWRPLTTREFEVARLIATGLTNGEIAGELSIAPKTASAHVEHILAKLGVARRAEIATWVATVAHPPTETAPVTQGLIAHR